MKKIEIFLLIILKLKLCLYGLINASINGTTMVNSSLPDINRTHCTTQLNYININNTLNLKNNKSEYKNTNNSNISLNDIHNMLEMCSLNCCNNNTAGKTIN